MPSRGSAAEIVANTTAMTAALDLPTDIPRAKIAALDAYLAQMDAELGPVPDAELREAAAWAEGLVAGRPTAKSASSGARQTRSA